MRPPPTTGSPAFYLGDDRGQLHLYRKKALLNHPVVSALSCIDAGIALAHLQIAAEAAGRTFSTTRLYARPGFRNFVYQFTLQEEGDS